MELDVYLDALKDFRVRTQTFTEKGMAFLSEGRYFKASSVVSIKRRTC